MNSRSSHLESSFVFDCHGDDLVGFLHHGRERCDLGVLTIVAGGPQYRAGVGRQLVDLGRRLAEEGYWVMRFDHRGVGDSEGEFRGFRFVEDDLRAALAEFKARAPGVRRVILWGGCDSATAALINAHKFPQVVGVIAGNPFVRSATSARRAARLHYFSRLKQGAFWKKLARGEYKPGQYFTAALQGLLAKVQGRSGARRTEAAEAGSGSFLEELRTGLCHFNGRVLFLMGDRFLLSDEFDALVASTAQWRSAYARPNHERIDIRGGDQVFSSRAAQQRMFEEAVTWIRGAFPDCHTSNRPAAGRRVRRAVDVSQ